MARIVSYPIAVKEPEPPKITELELKVCDKEDCPLYGCYSDPMKYGPFKKEFEKMKVVDSNTLYKSLEIMATKMRTSCLACIYFNKIDIYSMMIVQEAKDVLNDGLK